MVRVTFGINVGNEDDEDDLALLYTEALSRIVDEGPPGACLIDLFPYCEFYHLIYEQYPTDL